MLMYVEWLCDVYFHCSDYKLFVLSCCVALKSLDDTVVAEMDRYELLTL